MEFHARGEREREKEDVGCRRCVWLVSRDICWREGRERGGLRSGSVSGGGDGRKDLLLV